ncbi:MAG: ABC transporter permease [Spirochaetaceae bacterium]|jgi:peptide/nickel transport system permease protein|nr:ABC transporter permease [Spirochaetaceae bacterium]
MIKKITLPLRRRIVITLGLCAMLFVLVFAKGLTMPPSAWDVDFNAINQPPSWKHFFGTDWLGRDMFSRTVKGLTTSIVIGLIASLISAALAVVLGIAAASLGRKVDAFVNGMVNVFLSVPHLILLVLIAIACGKGLQGVLIGVAATHWTSLARIIRAEVLALKNARYISCAQAFGKSNLWIAGVHFLPHIIPQCIIGVVLLFPHSILHESSVTFLGFGLSPEQPAIGVILSESMRYLSAGLWHLAVFPGLSLLIIVMLFDIAGEQLRLILNPGTAHL